VADPAGEPIHAGKEEFAKALKLIGEGKPIKYEGVIGPVSFDQYGDITGPFRLWQASTGEDGRGEDDRRRDESPLELDNHLEGFGAVGGPVGQSLRGVVEGKNS
jgi:hypothetical protein